MRIADCVARVKPFEVMEIHRRATELEAAGKTVVHMEIGEPDFPVTAPVKDAAESALRQGHIHYTPAAGLQALRERIAHHYRQRYNLRVPVERIFITPGASGGLMLILRLLLNAGERLLMTDPGYPCHSNLLHLLDAEPGLLPVTADNNFQPNAKLLAEHWTANTRGLLLTSPSNPTGSVVADDTLVGLWAELQKRSAAMVVDETYLGLVYDRPDHSALSLVPDAFFVNSFSKYFGMTGWRLGWIVVPERQIADIEKMAQNYYISAASISQKAALAAFDPENLAVLEIRRREFQTRRDFLLRALQQSGFRLHYQPEGGFYLYADCSGLHHDSYELALQLLADCGVAVTPGRDFGSYRASSYLRFAYTRNMATLQEGMARIKRFLG